MLAMPGARRSPASGAEGRRWARLGALLALLVLPALPAAALTNPGRAAEQPKAFGYTGWDESYFYFAARVQDPAVTGRNVGAFSQPWDDDSIDLCFDVSGAAPQQPDRSCARLAVSAAAGFTALVGSESGAWRAASSWLQGLRFDAAVQGTLNKPGDTDQGYIVEVAIPWRHLGGTPRPGAEIGFAFAVHLHGEQDGFASCCPALDTAERLDAPAAWCRLTFSAKSAPQEVQPGAIVCPRLAPPLVDGKLSPLEWMNATVIPIALPKGEAAAPLNRARGETSVAAFYIFPPAGAASALQQPLEGLGPWWNASQAAWHRRQIRQLRQAAIDIIAVAWPQQSEGARAALAALVQALMDVKRDGYTYPLVALQLDPAALPARDLRTAQAADALYGSIREFFLAVPPEFRAQVMTDQGRAQIIILKDPDGIENWDGGFTASCGKAFEKEFGSALVWLGESRWKEKGAPLHASWSQGKPPASGPSAQRTVSLLSAASADRYEVNLAQTVRSAPDFLLIDSWNDFARATAICPSRQHGPRLVDATRQRIAQLMDRSPSDMGLRLDTLPRAIPPGGKWQVEMLLSNRTLEGLATSKGISFEYALRDPKNPRLRGTSTSAGLRLPASSTMPVLIEVNARGATAAPASSGPRTGSALWDPLPEGRYILTLRLGRSRVPMLVNPMWEKMIAEVNAAVTVGRVPGWAASVLSSALPARVQAGGAYPVQVRLRNDGSALWRKGKTRLAYRWTAPDGQPLAAQPPPAQAAELPRDVSPGQIVTVPLEVAAPDQPGPQVVVWEIADGDRTACQSGIQGILIVAQDPGARIVRREVPPAMKAGEHYQANVVLGNSGPQAWKPGDASVTAEWHYLDGAGAGLSDSAPIQAQVAPGSVGVAKISLRAPLAGGVYLLNLRPGFAGSGPGASPQDMDTVVVRVTGGPFEPVDLSPHLNATVTTAASRRSGGDFDGTGRSLPAEYLPPDPAAEPGAWYPCGYYGGPNANRQIPFTLPARKEGRGSAVACNGQALTLPAGAFRIHLLAAAARDDVAAEFTLVGASGERRAAPLNVGGWLRAPADAQEEGLAVPLIRTATADEPTPAYLHHYVIASAGAASLELPKDPRIRLLALTIERAAAPQ